MFGKSYKKLSRKDPMRLLIRQYMRVAEEDDLSIPNDRGLPTTRHKDLITAIQVAAATGKFKSDYSSGQIFQTINEEQKRRYRT